MIMIEKTCIVGRYNLVDTSFKDGEDRHIRQLDILEVKLLAKSIIDLI